MSKYRATVPPVRPSIWEIPETYLLIAVAVAGLMVGALPVALPVTLLLSVGVIAPMAALAVIPAPSTARRAR